MDHPIDHATDHASPAGERSLQLIVAYKLVKAAAEGIVALVAVLWTAGVAADLRHVGLLIQAHAIAAWSTALAQRMLSAATARTVHVLAVAALLDGALCFVEGWALHRRYAWGRWLVVVATASLLPLEGIALARQVTVGRLAILGINLLIVLRLLARDVGPRQLARTKPRSSATRAA